MYALAAVDIAHVFRLYIIFQISIVAHLEASDLLRSAASRREALHDVHLTQVDAQRRVPGVVIGHCPVSAAHCAGHLCPAVSVQLSECRGRELTLGTSRARCNMKIQKSFKTGRKDRSVET